MPLIEGGSSGGAVSWVTTRVWVCGAVYRGAGLNSCQSEPGLLPSPISCVNAFYLTLITLPGNHPITVAMLLLNPPAAAAAENISPLSYLLVSNSGSLFVWQGAPWLSAATAKWKLCWQPAEIENIRPLATWDDNVTTCWVFSFWSLLEEA